MLFASGFAQSGPRAASPRRKPVSIRLALVDLEVRSIPGFLAPVTSPGGGVSLAAADFNHDGRSDVAVVTSKDSASVRLSNGDGTFTQSAILTGAQGDLYEVSASDVNGDGNLDVVARGAAKQFQTTFAANGWMVSTGFVYSATWMGKGDGTFGRATMKTKATVGVIGGWPPTGAIASAVADFNGDGILDLAATVVPSGTQAVQVQFGNADGTLQVPQFYDAGPNPGLVVVGDINGDGRPDLIVVNSKSSSTPTLSVLLNDGNW